VVTYAEANTVLPFVNNIWTVQLTGAELKQIFEEQWSVANPGEPTPSRPFLNLGVSDNVRITRDPTRPLGHRITSVRLNGKLISPTKTYTVCTFSFLGTGGDYFHSFTKGVAHDTGLVDRDLWITYLKAHPGLAPSFDRQQVDAHGLPIGKVGAGRKVSFTLTNLDLTSLGSPANATVDVYLNTPTGARKVGTYKATDDGTNGGAAIVSFTAPQGLAAPSTISAVAHPSNTLIGATPKSFTKVADTKLTYGHPRTVSVTVGSPTGENPTGKVVLRANGKELGRAKVVNGVASIRVNGTALTAGTYAMTARYQGDTTHSKSSDTATLRVKKATPGLHVVKKPRSAVVHRTRVTLKVHLTSKTHPVKGAVQVRTGGRVYRARIHNEVATFHLLAFASTGRKTVIVKYLGNNRDHVVKRAVHLRVHR
jgi:5'-nucleotidase